MKLCCSLAVSTAVMPRSTIPMVPSPPRPSALKSKLPFTHSADSVMRRRSRPFAAPVGRLAGVQVGVHQVVREQHLVVDVDAFQRTPTREVTSGLRAAFAGSRRRAPRCTM